MRVVDRDTANLLRAVVRKSAAGCDHTIPELARKISCWEEVIEAARQHGILPGLFSALAANQTGVDSKALELARSEFDRNAFHCFANAAELLEVLRLFERSEIAAIPFKGVVLGASAYGDMTARTAGDLDILIRYRDLLPAAQLMKERGYELKTDVLEDGSPAKKDYFEYHFERPDDGMVLELRWRLELTQPRYRHDIGLDWVWPRRRMTRLAGADVLNFDAASCLLMLCMHGSKHVWSRLVWICDVARLLESEPRLDWDFVRQEAKRVGLTRCVALGVLLAREISGAEVPTEVLRRFEGDRRARKLAEFLGKHVAENPGMKPDGLVPYFIQLLGFWQTVAVMLSPKFLQPTARDRSVVKLPKALASLYYLIRPVRLLLDRKGR
ncbi:nucleotidyltransferase family protein [Telmatobacter sp. DSM 110680]|uniref:Nucleotidyltransferase family protein n=1 Tax=Telmatobacter sp. DSM 110680 TaxID=3036704 RepID=A0AAU7DEY7_9BACT